jgi:hypothetical protein
MRLSSILVVLLVLCEYFFSISFPVHIFHVSFVCSIFWLHATTLFLI